MDQQLLDRFFRGRSTAEEQQKVLAWYLSGEADHELAKKIEACWSAQDTQPQKAWGKEELFEKIEAEIQGELERPEIRVAAPNPRRLLSWHYVSAASALLIAASAVFFFIQTVLETAPAETLTEEAPPPDMEIIKQTAAGEKLTVTLADSTVIRLNSESHLRYWSSRPREAYLQGEAFFDVKRDTLRPFLIHTADITTTVLGTSFNIRAFAEDENIAVSVVSGEVKVEKQKNQPGQVLHLAPGEQATYHIKDTLLSKGTFVYEDVLSWKEGRLHFKNARFSEIIQQLERWYGVEIELKRAGIESGFSGSYTNRSLESVLEGMSFVLDFEFEIQDKQVIIR